MAAIKIGSRRWWIAGASGALTVTLGVGVAFAGSSLSGSGRPGAAAAEGLRLGTGSVKGTCQVSTLPLPEGISRAVVDTVDHTGRYAVGRPLAGDYSDETLILGQLDTDDVPD